MTTTITQNSNQSVIPVTVTNNVTKGDYVYQYGANIGWPKPTNTGAGTTTFLLNPTLQSSNVATVNAKSITTSPMTETYTYTGATLAENTVTTATTSVDASATHVSKTIGLVGGNFVNLFMSATNTLSAKVFNDAGVQQGSTLTLATNCTASGTSRTAANMFSGCGMADGGYVVVYKNTSTFVGIVRVNSSGAITFGPVVINASHQINADIPGVCPTTSGGYLISFSSSATNIGCAIYTASNVYSSGSPNSLDLNSILSGFGLGSAIETFQIPLCLQNGNMLIFANAGIYPGDYSYTYNAFFYIVLNANATTWTDRGIQTVSATTAGYLTPFVAACGSTTDPSVWFANTVFDISSNMPQMFIGTAPLTGGIPVTTSLSLSGSFGLTTRQVGVAPAPGGTANFYVWNTANNLQTRRFNASGTAVSSVTTLTTVGTSSNYSLGVFNTGWKTLVNFTPNTTNIPSFLIHQTQALANGTAFASTPYTPAQNYYLIGVAQNTATSGNTCWVQTEGVAQLGAGFASGNLLFDYVGSTTNSTAKSAIKGNSGTTSGTSVILKGLK